MKSKLVLNAFACVALLAAYGTARADIVVSPPNFDSSNQALPPDTTDYEGNFFDGSSAPYDIAIGTFTFKIPTGFMVLGATISGTFGDQNIGVTALTDLFVNGGIQVGACDNVSDPCATGTLDGSLVAWSHTFTGTELSELASEFASGSLTLSAMQNSFGAVIVGTPTLDIQVVPTPEPALIFPLAGGLLAIAVLRRRK